MQIFILILHVLGAGILIGVSVFAFAAALRPPLTQQALDRMSFVWKFGMWASGAQFITGVLLIMQEPDELARHPLIWTKVILWMVEGMLASMVIAKQAKRAQQALASNQPVRSAGLRVLLGLQLTIFVAIVALGVIVVEA